MKRDLRTGIEVSVILTLGYIIPGVAIVLLIDHIARSLLP